MNKWLNKHINNTGYLPNTESSKNSYNIIPSNNITMNTVPIDIIAYPNVGKPQYLEANSGNYNFPNADYVTEIPVAQNGGIVNKYPLRYQDNIPNTEFVQPVQITPEQARQNQLEVIRKSSVQPQLNQQQVRAKVLQPLNKQQIIDNRVKHPTTDPIHPEYVAPSDRGKIAMKSLELAGMLSLPYDVLAVPGLINSGFKGFGKQSVKNINNNINRNSLEQLPNIYSQLTLKGNRHIPQTVIEDASVKGLIPKDVPIEYSKGLNPDYPVTPNKWLDGYKSNFGKMEKGTVNSKGITNIFYKQ